VLHKAQQDFAAARATTSEVLAAIKKHYDEDHYLFCPHSACGVVAAEKQAGLANSRMVVLATAHAGKFYDNVQKAVQPLPPLPELLQAVQTLPMRATDLPCNLEACKAFVYEECGFDSGSSSSSSSSKGPRAPPSPVVLLPVVLALGLMFYSST